MASSDSFDRADSTTSLGTADTGETWSVLHANTTWGIKDNMGYCVDANDESVGAVSSIAVIDTGLADCIIDVDMVDTGLIGGRNASGLAFRSTDNQNWWTVADNKFSRAVAGAVTNFAAFSPPITDGDHLQVVLNGGTVQVYVNGVLKDTRTDTDHTAVTKHGLYSADRSTPVTNRFDNFTVGPLGNMHVGYVAMG